MSYADWFYNRDVTRHGFLAMHVVLRFLLRIVMPAENHYALCKRMQHNKALLIEPASVKGLHKFKGLG